MAQRTHEEFMTKLKAYIGERSDDETLSLIEDLNDTWNDYDTKLADRTDWEQKYNDNEAAWRQRYRDRFFAPVTDAETKTEVYQNEPVESSVLRGTQTSESEQVHTTIDEKYLRRADD